MKLQDIDIEVAHTISNASSNGQSQSDFSTSSVERSEGIHKWGTD
jgi:hypothetical protein